MKNLCILVLDLFFFSSSQDFSRHGPCVGNWQELEISYCELGAVGVIEPVIEPIGLYQEERSLLRVEAQVMQDFTLLGWQWKAAVVLETVWGLGWGCCCSLF